MRKRWKTLLLAAVCGLLALPGSGLQVASGAAVEHGGQRAFLAISGIEGESEAEGHEGEIDVESWSWGESNPATLGGGGGGGTGKVMMQDIQFTKKYSKASPKLFLACATGQHFEQAVLTLRKGGKEPLEYLVVTLKEILVSSYQTGGSGDAVPTEQISLNFASIEFEYKVQKRDGSVGETVRAGYDQRLSREI